MVPVEAKVEIAPLPPSSLPPGAQELSPRVLGVHGEQSLKIRMPLLVCPLNAPSPKCPSFPTAWDTSTQEGRLEDRGVGRFWARRSSLATWLRSHGYSQQFPAPSHSCSGRHPFPVSLPPLLFLVFPVITSQMNNFPSNPCFTVSFWEEPN